MHRARGGRVSMNMVYSHLALIVLKVLSATHVQSTTDESYKQKAVVDFYVQFTLDTVFAGRYQATSP